MSTLTVTFDRIGRTHDLPPLVLAVPDVADIAEFTADTRGDVYDAIYNHARPHLMSSDVEVVIQPPNGFLAVGVYLAAEVRALMGDRTQEAES